LKRPRFGNTSEAIIADEQLTKNRLSDYVGSVNQILSALQPALGEERHLALDEEVLLQPKARS
jgi:hypothetical protein